MKKKKRKVLKKSMKKNPVKVRSHKTKLKTKTKEVNKVILNYSHDLNKTKQEISKLVVGYEEVVDGVLRALLANGHVLIEGVPGVAKTLLIRTLAEVAGCKFSRIQFTVDLLPADITGLTTYTPNKGFETIRGPIFANFIIADEVNRAPPKTQSALLEAMQEKQVTIGRNTFRLAPPFFVMANNNPIESSGTYKLPEAQVDRFLFKLNMGYLKDGEEENIIDQNITIHNFDEFNVKKILSPNKIQKMQRLTKKITLSPSIKKYIIRIVNATRNPKILNIRYGKYIEWGGSPRASIALGIGARADAFLKGQDSVVPQNVKNIAHDVLRHRLILNYAGQAENINPDKIIDEILAKVAIP